MLYEIQPTNCPAHRLDTQQVGYTTKKENKLCSGADCSNADCSNTHNIISSMAPHEFNVVLRTTTDEFNVIPGHGYDVKLHNFGETAQQIYKHLIYDQNIGCAIPHRLPHQGCEHQTVRQEPYTTDTQGKTKEKFSRLPDRTTRLLKPTETSVCFSKYHSSPGFHRSMLLPCL